MFFLGSHKLVYQSISKSSRITTYNLSYSLWLRHTQFILKLLIWPGFSRDSVIWGERVGFTIGEKLSTGGYAGLAKKAKSKNHTATSIHLTDAILFWLSLPHHLKMF